VLTDGALFASCAAGRESAAIIAVEGMESLSSRSCAAYISSARNVCAASEFALSEAGLCVLCFLSAAIELAMMQLCQL